MFNDNSGHGNSLCMLNDNSGHGNSLCMLNDNSGHGNSLWKKKNETHRWFQLMLLYISIGKAV
jgi:hypothetical protein